MSNHLMPKNWQREIINFLTWMVTPHDESDPFAGPGDKRCEKMGCLKCDAPDACCKIEPEPKCKVCKDKGVLGTGKGGLIDCLCRPRRRY